MFPQIKFYTTPYLKIIKAQIPAAGISGGGGKVAAGPGAPTLVPPRPLAPCPPSPAGHTPAAVFTPRAKGTPSTPKATRATAKGSAATATQQPHVLRGQTRARHTHNEMLLVPLLQCACHRHNLILLIPHSCWDVHSGINPSASPPKKKKKKKERKKGKAHLTVSIREA